jgi:N-acetylmuramoyl-L-alanine amidase
MIKKLRYRFIPIFFILLVVSAISCPVIAKDFVVVIDPGHGGRDPGALGKLTNEKTINLRVALRLGKKIKRSFSDVKVIYTRNKDIFIPLNKRAQIANKANADLFISVHTNSVKRGTVYGTETFTLGLSRVKANFEVAKRENSVIEIEDNYQETYAGFDPSSAESYIVFEFIQDSHMKESVEFARLVQKQFKSYARRVDRGVHQERFLVLRKTSMPSVLIELGFISTRKEERFLKSSKGVEKMAESIFRAFKNYKNNQSLAHSNRPQTNSKPISSTTNRYQINTSKAPIFKVQILTSSKKLSYRDKRFKKHKNISYYKERGIYKYTIGASTNYNQMNQLRRNLSRHFKGAFLVAFHPNGTKLNIHKAIKQFKQKH